jgi:pyruvate,water dikinase
VAFDYDERDPGVKALIRLAIQGCRRAGIHSGRCGQAPSDYPDMAESVAAPAPTRGISTRTLWGSNTPRVLDLEARPGHVAG